MKFLDRVQIQAAVIPVLRTRVSQPRVLRVPVAEARLWAMHADFSRKKM